jgi:thioredoxin 1
MTRSPATAQVGSVTDATWTAEVLLSPVPVLVEFTADWCAPCRRIAPVLDELAAERGDAVRVVSLDVDANPDTARDYGVLSLPTLTLFRAGQPVRSVVGAVPKRKLADLIDG